MLKKSTLAFFSFVFVTTQVFGQAWQEKLSVHTNLAYLWPLTDNNGNDHDFNRFNIGLDLGIGYQYNERLVIRGAWLMGIMDGYNVYYSQTFISEPGIFADYNILPWFKEGSKAKLNVTGGLGFMFFYANAYDRPGPDRQLILAHPADGAAFSKAATVTAGGQFQYPVTDNISLQLQTTLKYLYANDYLDAFENGAGTDFIATVELGAVFQLGKSVGKDEMLIKKSNYDALAQSEKSTKEEMDELRSRHQMDMQEKNLRISGLQTEVDSLRAEKNKRVLPVEVKNEVVTAPVDVDAPMWRVIIGSFPSQARAQQFVDRVSLDRSEMQILYIEEINTYRVVYKSFDNVNAAMKAKGEARTVISDAWVVKF